MDAKNELAARLARREQERREFHEKELKRIEDQAQSKAA